MHADSGAPISTDAIMLSSGPPLRFTIGTRVHCNCGEDFSGAQVVDSGTIIQLHFRDDNGSWFPYQIITDEGACLLAPLDDDSCIRVAQGWNPKTPRQKMMQAADDYVDGAHTCIGLSGGGGGVESRTMHRRARNRSP